MLGCRQAVYVALQSVRVPACSCSVLPVVLAKPALITLQVAAWVNFIRGENLFYPACTGMYNGKQCNKKLQDQGSGW